LDAHSRAVAGQSHGDGGEERGALAALIDDHSSRRRFLRALGGTAGASALTAVASACGNKPTIGGSQRKGGQVAAFGPGDSGIVNYALFLEYLEGDFYDRLVRSDEVRGRRARDVVKQIRQNESEHRNLLDRIADQLGRPLRKPKTNFDAVFDRGPEQILAFAGMLENLGAAAYLGQAEFVVDRGVLASLLTVHTVEARQAAALNELAGRGFAAGGPLKGSIPTGPFATPMTMDQVLKRVRPYYIGGIPTLRPPVS